MFEFFQAIGQVPRIWPDVLAAPAADDHTCKVERVARPALPIHLIVHGTGPVGIDDAGGITIGLRILFRRALRPNLESFLKLRHETSNT